MKNLNLNIYHPDLQKEENNGKNNFLLNKVILELLMLIAEKFQLGCKEEINLHYQMLTT